jgi:hypothetical protein
MISARRPLVAGERMARRTFHVIDITEILAHWYAGRSQHDVAGSLGVARGTIRRYVEPAIAAGFVPGGTPPMSQTDWEPLVKQWSVLASMRGTVDDPADKTSHHSGRRNVR